MNIKMRARSSTFKHLKNSKHETLRNEINSSGNLQGQLLTPLLFTVFTDIYEYESPVCYPEGTTILYADDATGIRHSNNATGFRHSKKKLDKLFKSTHGCIKCEDHENYTRGLKIVLAANVI